MEIFDSNAEDAVSSIFGPDNSKRRKIPFQIFLYDLFVENDTEEGGIISNSVYAPARLFVSKVQSIPSSQTFTSMMKERLSGLLKEIADPDIPFSRTGDTDTCSYCDFKMICGR